LVAAILGGYGYDESLAVQSPEVIGGIKLLVSVFPTITFMVGIGCLFFYAINKKMEVRIETDLSERRRNNASNK
jgi:Na+/melibiose symporter-like transporter